MSQTRSSGLRITVTGLAVTYPFGGVFWDYVQYLVGLRRLGHDVLYVEDTGKWCYDPGSHTFVAGGATNAESFARHVARLGPELGESWFFRDAEGRTFGRSPASAKAFCETADLFLHLSASCLPRAEYLAAKRRAFVDSDPLYTQAGLLEDAGGDRLTWWRDRHDVFFTFGENVGSPECSVPTGGIDWIPTRQPIVLDRFAAGRVPVASRRCVLTTVASWEPAAASPSIAGIRCLGKSVEFERFLGLPARSVAPLELAMSGPAPIERLRAAGFHVRSGLEVSSDPWIYRDYLAGSLGEWSVAKNAYVVSRSGWFSCRTACYLALGVPAVVQDTGTPIPGGMGVIYFSDPDGAAAAIESLVESPANHARAAVEIASAFFDSDAVLTRLVELAMGSSPAAGKRGPVA